MRDDTTDDAQQPDEGTSTEETATVPLIDPSSRPRNLLEGSVVDPSWTKNLVPALQAFAGYRSTSALLGVDAQVKNLVPALQAFAGYRSSVLPGVDVSWVRNLFPAFHALAGYQNSVLQSVDQRLLQHLWEVHGPENWTLLGFDRRAEAEAIIESEGIPLVWVPSPDLVVELCDAPDFAARCQLIDDRAVDIAEGCRKVLAEIPAGGRVPKLVAEAEQAIGAFEAGFPGPAQSHAANLVDSTLRNMNRQGAAFGRTLSRFVYSQVISLCATTSGATTLANYRSVWVLAVMPMTFTKWDPDKGDPVPATFSRHATSHALDDPDQHCRVNALVSIMVGVSLLREVHDSSW